MITRYVDTAAASGGDGSTELLTGGTCAFDSWRAALIYLNSIDPLSDEATVTFKCSTGDADTDNVTQAHWDFVTSTANKVNLTVDPDHRHPGRWDSSKYRLEVTNEDGMYSNIPAHIWMTGFQIQVTATDNGNEYRCYRASTANNQGADVDHRFYQCIARGVRTGTSVVYGWHNSDPSGATGTGICRVMSSSATGCTYGFGSDGSTWAETNLRHYNTTSALNDYGYINPSRCVNAIGASNTSGDFVATGSNGHFNNASSDDSALGTNSRIDQVFSFKDAAGGDFRLLSTDTGAYTHGLDDPLSGLYSVDLAGTAWPTGAWSIGALGVVVPTAALTGTAMASITEADIVAGGKTIIVTLTDDTFVANTVTPPTLGTDVATESGNNTATGSWAVSHPDVAAGDLVIFHISWDDSATTTDVTEPAGPNSEVLSEINATPAVSSNTACRCKVWWTIATAPWTAGTLTFTPSANEQWTAAVAVHPAGTFDATTSIGANTTHASSGVTETAVLSAAFSAGATDGDGRLFCWTAANQDPQTLAADWTQVANQDRGIVSGGLFSRDAAVTDSESIAEDTVSTIAGDDWCSVSYIVRPPTATPFEAARQAFIDGFDSAQSETNGWNAEVRDKAAVTEIARDSPTQATWTIGAQAGHNITAQEVITGTIPASILTGGSAIVAAPTFTIDPTGGGGGTPVAVFQMHRVQQGMA